MHLILSDIHKLTVMIISFKLVLKMQAIYIYLAFCLYFAHKAAAESQLKEFITFEYYKIRHKCYDRTVLEVAMSKRTIFG